MLKMLACRGTAAGLWRLTSNISAWSDIRAAHKMQGGTLLLLACFGRIMFRLHMVAQALGRREFFHAKPTLDGFWYVRDEFFFFLLKAFFQVPW